MLVRKDNEIEIWTDVMQKGTAKKCFIVSGLATIFFLFYAFQLGLDYSMKETQIFICFLLSPCFFVLICGFISLKAENNKHLVLKINSEFIEINRKKDIIKISLKQISKLTTMTSLYGSFIVIFYRDDNIEKKYSFPISASNRGLVKIAIKEYLKDIIIDEKNIR